MGGLFLLIGLLTLVMSIQKFPCATIQKVRQYIQSTLDLPDSEQQAFPTSGFGDLEELPEPESVDELSGLFSMGGLVDVDSTTSANQEQWFVSTVNPGAALLKLPGLRLKPEYRLVSYIYRSEDSGVGVVWAVPEALSTTAQLEKALVGAHTIAQVPKPPGALSSLMEAIDGDRSPASFVIASILRRELQEFGAMGQRCNWSHHRLIDAVPAKMNWVWRAEQPKDLSPKVRQMPDGQAAVEFFTCRTVKPLMIYRHLDQYPADSYKSTSLDRQVAVTK